MVHMSRIRDKIEKYTDGEKIIHTVWGVGYKIEKTKQRLDRLIHPTGSLGKIEDICMQLAGIFGNENFDTSKK
ncbi:hypothetical protein D1N53_24070, partial [Clostridioides difficile]